MWTIRVAHDRDDPAAKTRALARSLDIHSLARTYFRGSDSAEADATVSTIFLQLPELTSLSLTWISKLLFLGSEYIAGESWISFDHSDEDDRILGFIPEHGIFVMQGLYYMLIHMYPLLVDTAFETCHKPVWNSLTLQSSFSYP